MLEVKCADLGLTCRGKVKARTKEELIQKVAEHAGRKHGVPGINQTLGSYAVTVATGEEEES